eukprot:84256-Rhodomonas_salina.5
MRHDNTPRESPGAVLSNLDARDCVRCANSEAQGRGFESDPPAGSVQVVREASQADVSSVLLWSRSSRYSLLVRSVCPVSCPPLGLPPVGLLFPWARIAFALHAHWQPLR